MSLDLVDQIYECAFLPDLWPKLLDQIARLTHARGGVLLTINSRAGILRWTASEPVRETTAEFVSDGWLTRSARFGVVFGTQNAGFISFGAETPDELMRADPANRDFFWPRGLGWPAATMMSLPTGDTLVISIERDRARGIVEPETISLLNGLRPHLARSALLSARLQLERASAISETLTRIGVPALVLDDRGRVLAGNALAEALTEHLCWRPNNQVSLRDPRAEALLKQAIATLGTAIGRKVRSFPVRGPDAQASLVAHVVPMAGTARDLITRCAATLVLSPVTLPNAPPAELIQSLFDLSPAEARVARHLTGGSTVNEIAAADGVSSNTVRTQVRGILEKTGCRRQTDMVALLGGIALPRG